MSRPGQRALDSLREWARRTGHEVKLTETGEGGVWGVAVNHGRQTRVSILGFSLWCTVDAVNAQLRAQGLRFVRRGGAPRGNRNASAANRRAAAKRRAA